MSSRMRRGTSSTQEVDFARPCEGSFNCGCCAPEHAVAAVLPAEGVEAEVVAWGWGAGEDLWVC